jgi:cell division protein FtsB
MRRLVPVIVIGVIFLLVTIYLPAISKYLKLQRKEIALDEKIAHLKTEIGSLEKEEYLLKTDLGHFEEVAREELGLVKPGEIVYKIVEEEIQD